MSASRPSASDKSPTFTRSPSTWLRRGLVAAIVIAVAGGAAFLYRKQGESATTSAWRTGKVERGGIRVAISATGTLAAIATVDVGSQISGQVTEVLADFNERVSKGQGGFGQDQDQDDVLLVRLEPRATG